MRDDFVGDIGDFGKYALLNALAGSDFTLLVNWYFNNQRGRAFQYLHQEKKYGKCCPRLYSAMQEIAKQVPSRLKEIESRRILPEKTIFFAEPVDGLNALQPQDQHRRKWHSLALEKARKADIVFLDPDNGLESEDNARNSKGFSKYFMTATEVQDYVAKDKSLILYHHFHRKESHTKQIQQLLKRLSLTTGVEAWGIRFGSVSPRVYVVIPSARHRVKLKERFLSFADGKCRKPLHLETYTVDANS
jgi:hypothetical protein